MDFKIGDFVCPITSSEVFRIVISPKGTSFGFSDDEIMVLALGEDSLNYRNNLIHGAYYVKVTPSKELIEDAKEKLRRSLLAERKAGYRYVDNLTFIEISDRLKEYEQELTRIS